MSDKKYQRITNDELRERQQRKRGRRQQTVRDLVFSVANAVRSGGVSVVVERQNGKAHAR
jgi:hypothetical protein